MTSLDRLPLPRVPALDPSGYNFIETPEGQSVSASYSPLNKGWVVWADGGGCYHMPGIDAEAWPDVWSEIIAKEQGE